MEDYIFNDQLNNGGYIIQSNEQTEPSPELPDIIQDIPTATNGADFTDVPII